MQYYRNLAKIPEVDIPSSLEECWELKQLKANATLISGGTLLQVQWETGAVIPTNLISLESIKELRGIQLKENNHQKMIEIGALTTLAACERNIILNEYANVLINAITAIAAPSVRNRATIGGNICSGVGDSIPALLILNAEVNYYNGSTIINIPLEQWLKSPELAYRYLLTHIVIPIKNNTNLDTYYFRKVGRREAFTAALVSVAIYCKSVEAKVKDISICIGGGDHIPHQLKNSESFIKYRLHEQRDVVSLYQLICDEIQTYTDAFATESYRKQVAANIIMGFLTEQFTSN
ncbi:FAD binding domain-containing protein [Bacillus sp. PS06]|uniref:FAD binding domain-containing protein n=1 Tax=Bacillus sp. PS06 TaxID=2764176 RepID=UPI00177F1246|nr:FAD binding domain-containing protein [Bacillus sp. PS06]MBD8068004.1 FAD binding domain-containing protein [Bacillus sp. PS06]